MSKIPWRLITFLAVSAILFACLNIAIEQRSFRLKHQMGVTFSPTYAISLGLVWKQVYLQMLDDLKVRNLRIPTYWNMVESFPDKYDFSKIDFMVEEAGKRQAKIILVVGIKQPRWPECHLPLWIKDLPKEEKQAKALDYIRLTVERYKNDPTIYAWQIENESLFSFGENCDKGDLSFVQKEVQLVKNIDPYRPVVLTDTGEWSTWIPIMQTGDIFGTSMYRGAYNKLFGYIPYPYPSASYSIKYYLIKLFFAPNNQEAFISEMQTEPWLEMSLTEAPMSEQVKEFPLNQFRDNVEFAKKSGFDRIYLWGVEWWYYAKEHGYPEYWDYAREIYK